MARLTDPPRIDQPVALEEALRAEVVRRLGHGASLEAVEPTHEGAGDEKKKGKGKPRKGGRKRTRQAARARCLVAGKNLGYGNGLHESEVASAHRRSGLRLVIAEGFAPPCEVSLANAGVVPLRFVEPRDYDRVHKGDELVIRGLARNLRNGEPIRVAVAGNGTEFEVACDLGERGREILVAGGLLGYLTKSQKATSPPPR